MGECVKCGADAAHRCELCMECSRKAIRAIFQENPELKHAFNAAIDELGKPESVKKMAEQITPVIKAVGALQKAALGEERSDV